MTSGSPSSPFLAGPMIDEPRYFVGRQAELDLITSRMTGIHPISVNLVGKRRIGKSSLLYHFCQTYRQRIQNPHRYVVIYLNLQNPQCQREEGFYQAAIWQLLHHPLVKANAGLSRSLKKLKSCDRINFTVALAEWKRQGVLPVFCLDEFEVWCRHPKAFNNLFFDNLRSLMTSNMLMLVVASHRSLDFYQRRYDLISPFFNLFEVISLREFTQEEARELVNLPPTRGASAALNPESQRFARQWGGCHPFLLQLAASLLWKADREGQNISWAQAKFEEIGWRIPGYSFQEHKWQRFLRWIFWELPLKLGRATNFMGATTDDVTHWIVGVVIAIAVILLAMGLLTLPQMFDVMQKTGKK